MVDWRFLGHPNTSFISSLRRLRTSYKLTILRRRRVRCVPRMDSSGFWLLNCCWLFWRRYGRVLWWIFVLLNRVAQRSFSSWAPLKKIYYLTSHYYSCNNRNSLNMWKEQALSNNVVLLEYPSKLKKSNINKLKTQ